MPELLPYKDDRYLWNYLPSLPGALVFVVLFSLVTIAHTWRMIRHRVWFHAPFVVGCLGKSHLPPRTSRRVRHGGLTYHAKQTVEAIGYVGYTIAHWHSNKLVPYIIQSIFLLIAPAFIAASIYMILGRLVTRLPSGHRCSIVRPAWLTKLFVLGDVLSLLTQAFGGGMMSKKGSKGKTGQTVIIVGLAIQIVTFGFFLASAVVFHVRYARLAAAGARGRKRPDVASVVPWQKILWMMYTVSAFIMARSIFRTVEYIQGKEGYILNHQWMLFVFDSTLMFCATVLFYVMYHPDDLACIVPDDSFIEAGTMSSVEMSPSSMEIAMPRK